MEVHGGFRKARNTQKRHTKRNNNENITRERRYLVFEPNELY